MRSFSVNDASATDPPGTAMIKITCPTCNGGRIGPIRHIDSDGRQIGETIG